MSDVTREYEVGPLNVVDGPQGVRLLELNRPSSLNSLDPSLVVRLHEEFDRLQSDHATLVVILTGAGRGFCSGADLSAESAPRGRFWADYAGSAQREWLDIQQRYSSLVTKMRRIPQPIVAAVNGPAVGAGFSLALASDIRILDPSAYFVAAQVNIGQAASEMGATYFLPRLIGARASEILLTGRRVDASEAEKLGLANYVSEVGGCRRQAFEFASTLAAKAPLSLRLSKEALNMSASASSIEQAVTADDRSQVLCTMSPDLLEGQRAFIEHRAPRFTG
jgi:enoyl-CoA hydratase